ncbi:MAG TPA: TolC family protein [Haliangiales bacterium]|nr:TolC family protein [Haliangiales bacterium]
MKTCPAVLCAVLATAQTAGALTLDEAVGLSRKNNERAKIAAENVHAAAGRVVAARAFFIPSLQIVGTYTRRSQAVTRDVGGVQTVIQEVNGLAGQANLTLTLFDARSIPLYRQALLERESARLGARDAVRLLGFDTGNAFLQTLGAQQVVGAAERRLELTKKTLGEARARFQAQLARSNDVTRAELDVATAEQALIQARGDLENARLNLGFLLGAQLADDLVEPAPLLEPAPVAAPEGLVVEAVKRRLDVAAARRHEEGLRAFAQEPLARFIPALNLLLQGRGNNEPGLTGRNFDWSLSVTMTWTLFDGGRGLGDRAERSATAEIQRLTTDASVRQIDVGVRQALVELANAGAGIKQAEVALAAARKNATEVGALYRQGLATALEEADANQKLYDAEVAAVRARYALGIAHLDVRAAVGLDVLGNEP